MNLSNISMIYLSHCLDQLASVFFADLFAQSQEPFAKRIVLVPDLGMKTYLMQQMALHPQITVAAALTIQTPIQSLSRIFKSHYFPSPLELTLKLVSEIEGLFQKKDLLDQEEKRIFSPLFEYLHCPSAHARMASLARQLSQLFLEYGMQDEEGLNLWLQENGWQQQLWKRIYQTWSYPLQVILNEKSTQADYYLWGFSYLPKCVLNFFKDLKASFYFFSPCEIFWEDFCSDRQRMQIKRKRINSLAKQEAFDAYTSDQHPFLANWGKLGRRFWKYIDESGLEPEFLESHFEKKNLLTEVQRDLLESNVEKKEFVWDQTIEIISSPTMQREVEILHDKFMQLNISPADIQVYAPKIEEYAPYIHAIFGSSQFPYSVEEHALNENAEAFLHLVKLPSCAFELEAVLKLFSFSSFAKKFDLPEVEELKSWISKANIRREDEQNHNWESGLERLLKGLVDFPSILNLNISQAERLNGFVEIILSLKKDLEILSKQMVLSQWMDYFCCLIESYFSVDCHADLLNPLRQINKNISTETPLAFDHLESLLEMLFTSKIQTPPCSNLQTTLFRSLDAEGVLPKKVIYVLGLQEENFPRKKNNGLMASIFKDRLPSQAEEDRYHFLQLLLSAKSHFILSYQRISAKDHQPLFPSPLVQDLKDYLERYYQVNCLSEHPYLPFDRRYFEVDSPIKSFSKKEFQAADSHYQQKPVDIQPFLESFHIRKRIEPILPKNGVVELNKLLKLMKHPLKFYFHETLEVFFSYSSEKKQEEFILSYLKKSEVRKKLFHSSSSFDETWKHFEDEAIFPSGIFKEMIYEKMHSEFEVWKENLDRLNIRQEDFVSIELLEDCREMRQIAEKRFVCPSLEIPFENGSRVKITGILESVSPKGFLFYGEDTLEDLIKIWPSYLVFLNLPVRPFSCETNLLCTESGEKKEFPHLDPVLAMRNLLFYHETAKQMPSPLMTHWAESLLNGSEETLKKAIDQSAKDKILLWILDRDPAPKAEILFHNWSSLLRGWFKDLI